MSMRVGMPKIILGLVSYAAVVKHLRVGAQRIPCGVTITNLSAKNVGTMNRRTE